MNPKDYFKAVCDERRDLKKKRYEAEGAKEYREANRRIQKAVKKAKEDWVRAQIETCPNKNNSKRVYQLVKDRTLLLLFLFWQVSISSH